MGCGCGKARAAREERMARIRELGQPSVETTVAAGPLNERPPMTPAEKRAYRRQAR